MSAALAMVPKINSVRPQLGKADYLRSLRELTRRASGLDAAHVDMDIAPMSAPTRELAGILRDTIASLSALQSLAPAEAESDEFPEFERETWVGARVLPELAPQFEDVCFAAALELNRALRELNAAQTTVELLGAAETARRKLHRAVHAVLAGAEASDPDADAEVARLRQRQAAELESALAVRRLYAEFRRALRRPTDDSPEAVLMALRYAAGALATLTASTQYQAVRLPDRSLLRRQRDRLLEWSRAGRPVALGLQILEDIWTSADLLRDINRRQELRAHDTELMRALLAPTAPEQPDWLARLERLRGLDSELDALLVRAHEALGPELVMDVLLRLSVLV